MITLIGKIVKANAILSEISQFVNETTLRFIYFGTFYSSISYVCTVWDQQINPSHRFNISQSKVLKIVNFAEFDGKTNPLFVKMENS